MSLYLKYITKVQKPKLKLFCFPYAGGSSSIYYKWKNYIDADIELIAIELPGRSDRLSEEPLTDITIAVDLLYDILYPYMDEPFAFFGHSMGGIIAYALTKKIELNSIYKPSFVIISASKPPNFYYQKKTYQLSDNALLNTILPYGGMSKEILKSTEFMALLMPVLRADYQLIETYKYNLDYLVITQIYLFNAEKDIEKKVILDWEKYFLKKINYYTFSGKHFFLNTETIEVINRINIIKKEISI